MQIYNVCVGAANFQVSNIPSLCTHVIYAFAILDPTTYTMAMADTWLDPVSGLGNYKKFTALKVGVFTFFNIHMKDVF